MIKIEVIKETIENINGTIAADLQLKVLPGTSNMKSLISAYRSCLETASRNKTEILFIPAIPSSSQSAMFQAIHLIYQIILDFSAATDTNLKKVCIFCDTDQVYNLYMVVWNLYYAKSKTERMNDGRWD